MFEETETGTSIQEESEDCELWAVATDKTHAIAEVSDSNSKGLKWYLVHDIHLSSRIEVGLGCLLPRSRLNLPG